MKGSEIGRAVLKTIGTLGVVTMLMVAPGMSRLLPYLGDNLDPRKFKRALYDLKRRKLIKTYYKDGKEFVEITKDGKKKNLSYDFEEMKVKKEKKWDGLFRVVIFDIPEKNKKTRKLFRYKLEDMGLYPIQDSVMITPYDCKDEIDFLRGYLFIDKYVKYMVVKEVDDTEKLKKLFSL